jgi:hypothetical protein
MIRVDEGEATYDLLLEMSAGDPGLSSLSAGEERRAVLLMGRARVRPRRAVRATVVLMENMMMVCGVSHQDQPASLHYIHYILPLRSPLNRRWLVSLVTSSTSGEESTK